MGGLVKMVDRDARTMLRWKEQIARDDLIGMMGDWTKFEEPEENENERNAQRRFHPTCPRPRWRESMWVVAQVLPWEGTRVELLQQCSCFTHSVHIGFRRRTGGEVGTKYRVRREPCTL